MSRVLPPSTSRRLSLYRRRVWQSLCPFPFDPHPGYRRSRDCPDGTRTTRVSSLAAISGSPSLVASKASCSPELRMPRVFLFVRGPRPPPPQRAIVVRPGLRGRHAPSDPASGSAQGSPRIFPDIPRRGRSASTPSRVALVRLVSGRSAPVSGSRSPTAPPPYCSSGVFIFFRASPGRFRQLRSIFPLDGLKALPGLAVRKWRISSDQGTRNTF